MVNVELNGMNELSILRGSVDIDTTVVQVHCGPIRVRDSSTVDYLAGTVPLHQFSQTIISEYSREKTTQNRQ